MDQSLKDWTPPPLPSRTPLRGRYVTLEPVAQTHVPDLRAAMQGADDMWHYMPLGPFPTEASYRAWVTAVRAETDPLHFAVIGEDGLAAGTMSFLRIAPAAGSIEVGWIAYTPKLQKTRAATEAVFLLMEWAFRAGYRRFEWKCDAANAGSRRAAQRYGLSFEGIFRQAAVVKGRNRDTAWFAAIDREWPALNAAFQAWLSPENFDDTGSQRQRLTDLTAPILVARDPSL